MASRSSPLRSCAAPVRSLAIAARRPSRHPKPTPQGLLKPLLLSARTRGTALALFAYCPCLALFSWEAPHPVSRPGALRLDRQHDGEQPLARQLAAGAWRAPGPSPAQHWQRLAPEQPAARRRASVSQAKASRCPRDAAKMLATHGTRRQGISRQTGHDAMGAGCRDPASLDAHVSFSPCISTHPSGRLTTTPC
ncbi:hypothetical protein CDD81_3553 [Ophiocordyceps australis]|uniref:Uncharacterized protein n=1 Tax=Ophiocordyceps australis TaxID=1399860 RepID=A0A2C5X772_9HYPO|nr:hypothetical protein CDD81_3553 [Ophiocordyceps australis]